MADEKLREPVVARSGSSIHSREDDEFTQQNDENPLEVRSTSSVQHTPSILERQNPMEGMHPHDDHGNPDDPPPPYEPLADEPQIAPVEYSCENSPQLLFAPPHSDISTPIQPPPRNPARLSGMQLPEVSPIQSPGSPAFTMNSMLVPSPLQIRSTSSNFTMPYRTLSPQETAIPSPRTAFSSAKAHEAGFEIQPPPSRSSSSSSPSSIIVLSSRETLRHSRESGKLTAYLIPFPKPRMKGVRLEDIPDRFLIYTPPNPPLSKPAPGEKESHLHKAQRNWQEDVRKATMSHASKTTWKGMKASATILIGKGVNMTRSSTVEFLDRVSRGAISSTEEMDAQAQSETSAPTPPNFSPQSPSSHVCPRRTFSTTSMEKESKPEALEELKLIFPPSLNLPPEKIRTEFVDTLLRAREKSRKEAVVASSFLPLAAAIDASLIITFGGLTEISGAWAYTSIRGAMTSKKMTQGLALGEEQAGQPDQTETRGCTCGHHEDNFGAPETVPKSKGKKKGINLQLQQSPHLEVLRRYLDLTCLKKDFNMFPHINESAGDVNEESVLEAIGWRPTRRQGRDLEVDFKDQVERLTPEQDEQFQIKEAKEDVRRIMKKGVAEWTAYCKSLPKRA